MPIFPDTRNVSYVTLSYHISDKVVNAPARLREGAASVASGGGIKTARSYPAPQAQTGQHAASRTASGPAAQLPGGRQDRAPRRATAHPAEGRSRANGGTGGQGARAEPAGREPKRRAAHEQAGDRSAADASTARRRTDQRASAASERHHLYQIVTCILLGWR